MFLRCSMRLPRAIRARAIERELYKSSFRQRHTRTVADDDVIQKANVHEAQRLLDSLSNQFIGLAGLGDTRRMIVSDDHGGRVALQGELDDLARMHAGAVDRAAK